MLSPTPTPGPHGRFRCGRRRGGGGGGSARGRWSHALVYNDAVASPFFRVRNLSVACARRFGALIEAHDGTLTESLFSNTSSQGVIIANGETNGVLGRLDGGYVTRNILISQNRFEHCYLQGPGVAANCKGGNGGGGSCAAVVGSVVVGADLSGEKKGSLLSWRGHGGLVIENNTVEGWQQGIAAVSIAGARNVSVRGNVLRAMTLGRHIGWRGADKAARSEETGAQWCAAIQVDNATRVTIEAKDIFGPFPHKMTAGAVRRQRRRRR